MPNLISSILRDVIDHELRRGNVIEAYETGWSRMAMVVRFAKPLDAAFAEDLVEKNQTCRLFSTADPHYRGEAFGIVDAAEAVTGPLS